MAQLFEEKKTIVSTLYGGTGGHLWDDGLYQGVSKITLFYAKCIKSIAVEYYSNNEIITASTHGGVGNFCVIPNPVTVRFLFLISLLLFVVKILMVST